MKAHRKLKKNSVDTIDAHAKNQNSSSTLHLVKRVKRLGDTLSKGTDFSLSFIIQSYVQV
jgi:hypothetical protein